MSHKTNQRRRILQAAIVYLAIAALLFMVTASSLDHHHAGASDATCLVCHIAHHAPMQTAAVVKLPVLVPVAHGVRCEARTPELELLAADHSSRAPPSA